jgi:hypothetical protein
LLIAPGNFFFCFPLPLPSSESKLGALPLVFILVDDPWHGIEPGYFLYPLVPFFYFLIEDLYNDFLVLKKATKLQEKLINATKWTLKSFTRATIGMALLLLNFASSWKFYESVYHIGYVLCATLCIAYFWIRRR